MGKYDEKISEDIAETELREERKKANLDKCKKEINKRLKAEDYASLPGLFQTEEMKEMAQLDNSFAIMHIVMSIYDMEQTEGVTEGILSGVYDMQEAEQRYLNMKFLMWRLEFAGDSAGLSEQIQQNHVSVPFLKYLIHTSSFDQANTAYKIAMLLKEHRRYANAFGMLRFVNELTPGEESVLCEMADIWIKMRQYQMAETCIQQIKNPTSILAKYQQQWESL